MQTISYFRWWQTIRNFKIEYLITKLPRCATGDEDQEEVQGKLPSWLRALERGRRSRTRSRRRLPARVDDEGGGRLGLAPSRGGERVTGL
jgi:hypothetical protein